MTRTIEHKTEGRYAAQVNTAGDPVGAWTGNQLRFDTVEDAKDYVRDLMVRWTAVRDIRVVDTFDSFVVWPEEVTSE